MQPDRAELGILDNLVTQFSSPLDCFRELVQNSIDAGSPTVEVWTEFIPGEGHEGTIALHIEDFGEGMDEKIIDDQFTRLFASTKERDLTKIGKFGIGFVSVFALDPKAILVQTGRGGEYWEVLFHADRSFSKTRLEVPVEGTQLTIFLVGDRHRYQELVDGTRHKLTHWCSHSETDIFFEDRTPLDGSFPTPICINEPFDVPGSPVIRELHEGTEIVAAYSSKPLYGFYNRGLTLALTHAADDVLDERAGRFYHVALKIKSRYLEHTLSRETVMRDANFEKAMRLLEDAVNDKLSGALVEELSNLCAQQDWDVAQFRRYAEAIGFASREPLAVLNQHADAPILRTVGGHAMSLEDAYSTWRRDGRLLVSTAPTPLTDQLERMGVPVLLDARRGASATHKLVRRFLYHRTQRRLSSKVRAFFGADLSAEVSAALATPDAVYLPVVLDSPVPPELRDLIERAEHILKRANTGYRSITTCRLGSPQGDPPLFVASHRLGPLMARPPRGVAATSHEERPEAAVNRDHPHFRHLLTFSQRQPKMAAYCLAKSLLLSADRRLEADLALMKSAMR